ncbi:GDSL-type esterase/lipase family protein [Candidatus Latescibacterota bacterium]
MSKNLLTASVLILIMLLTGTVFAQNHAGKNIVNGAYWKHKVSQFRTLPNPEGEICFLGDSITDGSEWRELTGCPKVTNRGISADTTWGILTRIDEVTEGKPAKIFLMIGTNDLAWGGDNVQTVHDNIGKIIDTIKMQSPDTEIYLQSIFPVVDDMRKDEFDNKDIDEINPMLEKLATSKRVTWVDIASVLKDENGQLKRELTEDGLHITGEAYYLWWSVIRKYFEN